MCSTISIFGQDVKALVREYDDSSGEERREVANVLMKFFLSQEYTDTLVQWPPAKESTMDLVVYSHAANWYLDNSMYGYAETYGKKAIDAYNANVDDNDYANALYAVSQALQRKGDLYNALVYQKKCFELDEKSGNKPNVSSSLNTMASLCLMARQPHEALEYALRSIAIERELGREEQLAIRLGMASEIYLALNDPAHALSTAHEAYELDKHGERDSKAAIRLSQMAAALIALHRYQEAESTISRALPILEAVNNTNSVSICYNQLGQLAIDRGDTAAAATHYEKARVLAISTGNKNVDRTASYGLFQAYRDTDPAKALKHLEHYSTLCDSMYKQETAALLGQFHSQYQNSQLTKKNDLLSQKNSNQHQLIIWSVIAILLLLGLLITLYCLLHIRTKATRMMRHIEKVRLNFYTKMTHELRTPLTVAMGESENIYLGRITEDEEIRHSALIINRNARHMLTITNQLLDITKIRTATTKPLWRHGNIRVFTAIMVESFHLWARQRNISLEYHHSGTTEVIDFPADYYQKIVYNLLSNSLKYTHEEGEIRISTATDGKQIELTVTDNGNGISEEDLPHIFEVFYVSNITTDSLSTGIGLALIKHLTDQLGGTVDVETEVGKGTTFHLVIPCQHKEKQVLPWSEEEKVEVMPANFTTKTTDSTDDDLRDKILVIDDNDDVRHYMGSLLRKDYSIYYASNGKQGIEKAKAIVPNLIITDLMMPGVSGEELCSTIRHDTITAHIPIIVVTAKVTTADKLTCLKAGADVFLVKPFNPDELLVHVEQLLAQRRQLAQLYSRHLHTTDSEDDTATIKTLNESDRQFLEKLDGIIYEQIEKGAADVETIASILCISSKQLRRKMFAITGETTIAYILHIRLERALLLLDNHPEMSIADIATKCGFDDNAHFSRTFKQFYELTPTQYRKKKKETDGQL